MAPELVLLAGGDVLICGGRASAVPGRAKRLPVERWVAATGETHVVELAPDRPPVDAVRWDGGVGGLVPLDEWPEGPRYGGIALPGGGRVEAGGRTSVDCGAFGWRPEVEATLVVRTPERTRTLALCAARAEPLMTLLRDGRVLVSGGYTVGMDYSWEDVYEGDHAVDVVDPARGTVRPGPALKTARYRHAAIEIAAGCLLVVGGASKDDSPIASIEVVAVDAVD